MAWLLVFIISRNTFAFPLIQPACLSWKVVQCNQENKWVDLGRKEDEIVKVGDKSYLFFEHMASFYDMIRYHSCSSTFSRKNNMHKSVKESGFSLRGRRQCLARHGGSESGKRWVTEVVLRVCYAKLKPWENSWEDRWTRERRELSFPFSIDDMISNMIFSRKKTSHPS